ncbi:MAG: ATP-binding protein [Acidobacteriota bacterium]|nr:ATP-binding protein [Acidobacteriota bacterium]
MTSEPDLRDATTFTVPTEALYHHCDPESLGFKTTVDLEDLHGIVGQDRAMEAVRFGVGMKGPGYNLYVLGPPGIGKHALITRILTREKANRARPDDLAYVNNFGEAGKPIVLSLPPGRGAELRSQMHQLVENLAGALPAAFESDEFRARAAEIEEAYKERHEEALNALRKEAEKEGFALVRTPMGYAFAPLKDGNVIPAAEFTKLDPREQEDLQNRMSDLQQRSEELFRKVPKWRSETQKQLKDLDRETAGYVVENLIEEIMESFKDIEKVQTYLDAVKEDVITNVQLFLEDGKQQGISEEDLQAAAQRRYEVNLLVDHGDLEGAPVVYEDNPTYQNLLGQVEHRSVQGMLVTDFTLIKSGALHRANGGYLILDVRKLLTLPYAWEGLKRALRTRSINIESLGQTLGLLSTVSLEPEQVPLDIKIFLLGDRLLYYLLCAYDPEFEEMFKVAADCAEQIDRHESNRDLYARLMATVARREELRPFHAEAVARIIEHASRLAEDSQKLSMLVGRMTDLLREADHWAGQEEAETIAAEHVQKALDHQFYRSGRIYERIQEAVHRGIIHVDTEGAVTGQMNGLSVMMLGNIMFGQPHRLTATARMGSGKVIDIEREVELGGATHSKGVLILANFLAGRFAVERPLSLSASLVFEQSYGRIEGDSASMAELCVLLSALSGLPIKQSFAMTGSVSQKGRAQAIGGVNEKIEGFYDVCRARGLTGEQGVIIPKTNVEHLMLRHDIVDAVREGRFAVYAVENVDEAMTLLTGTAAGKRNAKGAWPKGSVNGLVEARLNHFNELRMKHSGQDESATKKRTKKKTKRKEGGS